MSNCMPLLHQNVERVAPGSPDDFMAMMKSYMAWTGKVRSEGRHKRGQELAGGRQDHLRPGREADRHRRALCRKQGNRGILHQEC